MKIFGINLNIQKKRVKDSVLRFSRDDYIYWSVLILCISFLGLTGYDAYMFYQDVFNRSRIPLDVTPPYRFSDKDIDEIITLLDERQNAYDDILGTIPTVPAATPINP